MPSSARHFAVRHYCWTACRLMSLFHNNSSSSSSHSNLFIFALVNARFQSINCSNFCVALLPMSDIATRERNWLAVPCTVQKHNNNIIIVCVCAIPFAIRRIFLSTNCIANSIFELSPSYFWRPTLLTSQWLRWCTGYHYDKVKDKPQKIHTYTRSFVWWKQKQSSHSPHTTVIPHSQFSQIERWANGECPEIFHSNKDRNFIRSL